MRRVITISFSGKESFPSVLDKVRDTSAIPKGGLVSVPLKITSCILEPRNSFTDCSPKTHFIASKILLLPLPLGPTIAVIPGSNFKTVLSGNDLKPKISSFSKRIDLSSFLR